MSNGEDKKEYKALWVSPEIYKEVKNVDGHNDSERLKNWRKTEVDELTRQDVEDIAERMVESLVLPKALDVQQL